MYENIRLYYVGSVGTSVDVLVPMDSSEIIPLDSQSSETENAEVAETVEQSAVEDIVSSVSGNDVAEVPESEVHEENSVAEIETDSVSGNSPSVSGNSITYISNYTTYEEVVPTVEESYTIWGKPLLDYTVSEGLLLIIVCFVILFYIRKLFLGGMNRWL